MISACILFLALLVFGVDSARAEIPESLQGRQIVEVSIPGEPGTQEALREVGIPIGAPFRRSVVRAAILRLIQSGRWADVQVDAQAVKGGVRVVIRLTPQFAVTQIALVGNRALDEGTLREATGVTAGVKMSDLNLDALRESMREAYAERGYLSAKVEPLLVATANPAEKTLVVRIDEGPMTRITELTFRGQTPPDAASVLSAMGLTLGAPFNRQSISDRVPRGEKYLRDRGYLACEFASPLIAVGPESADIAIPSYIGPLFQVQIEGYWPLERNDVYEALELRQQRFTGQSEELNELSKRVTDLYLRYGYADARVEVRVMPGLKPNQARIGIYIDPGQQLQVIDIQFPGASFFSQSFLRDQVFSYLSEDLPGSSVIGSVDSKVVDDIGFGTEQRARRSLRPPPGIDPRATFYQATYDKAIAHIIELYQADGFLAASVGAARIQRLENGQIAVSMTVEEGPRTRLFAVVILGNELLGSRELLTEAALERDAPFSYTALETARLRIVDMYQERGYLYIKVDPVVRFSRDRTLAEATIQIVEGFPVHVDYVTVRGANRTSESIVRDVVRFEPGDLYRPTLARESEEKLLALGIFTGAKVALQEAELPARLKPLVVTVTERDTHAVELSAGISTWQGARTGLEYGYRNLFGQAINLSLRAQVSYQLYPLTDKVMRERFDENLTNFEKRLQRRIVFETIVPYLSFFPNLRTNIDLTHLRDNERDFGLVEYSAAVTFSYPLARRLTLSVGGDIELNNLELFVQQDKLEENLASDKGDADRLRKLLLVPPNDSTLLTVRTALNWDERDSPFIPTRGFLVSLSAELSGTPGTSTLETKYSSKRFVSRFVKTTVGTSGYLSAGAGVVFAGLLRVGGIFHLSDNSETYPNRAFFLGGVDTVRGYFEDAMMPQDRADEIHRKNVDADTTNDLNPNNVVRSADAFILVRAEMRFPIVGALQGGVFSDLGNLWSDPFGRSQGSVSVSPFALRPSAGVGMRFNSPVGPLALDYGILLLRRKWLGEPFGAWHLSIGLF